MPDMKVKCYDYLHLYGHLNGKPTLDIMTNFWDTFNKMRYIF